MEILDWIKTKLASASKLTLAIATVSTFLLIWLLWPTAEPEQISFESSESDSITESQISVHLVGEVINPGLYQLPIGSRVSDAVQMAGGVSENASAESINLARILIDGEQIIVKSSELHQQEMDSKISINDSAKNELETLSGVGPSIANKIIDHREQNGPFRSIEELTEISGIGPKMLESIKDQVRL